ncbi:MAG TPA: restriction endonuclease [Chthoniobacterales bacterium]|nr:restriction endonuclease [Chthoniobacterales bacterium]
MPPKNNSSALSPVLGDFVFLDHRLGDHPLVRANFIVERIARRKLVFDIKAGRDAPVPTDERIPALDEILSDILQMIYQRGPFNPPGMFFHTLSGSKVILEADAQDPPIGYLCLDTNTVRFREEELADRIRREGWLLATIVAYLQAEDTGVESTVVTVLANFLREVRKHMALSRAVVAGRIGLSVSDLARWERQGPPDSQSLVSWLRAVNLLAASKETIVSTIDVTDEVFRAIRANPRELDRLSPEQFERFVAGRFENMGYDVTLTGAATQKDGGIDMIAVPKTRSLGAFLLAGQIKHHRDGQKTGRAAADRLLAWRNSPFSMGVLVTNSTFTSDARWIAEQQQNRSFLRLRDFDDLRRWIEGRFTTDEEWREIPPSIQLAPGIHVKVPRPRIASFDPELLRRR